MVLRNIRHWLKELLNFYHHECIAEINLNFKKTGMKCSHFFFLDVLCWLGLICISWLHQSIKKIMRLDGNFFSMKLSISHVWSLPVFLDIKGSWSLMSNPGLLLNLVSEYYLKYHHVQSKTNLCRKEHVWIIFLYAVL